VQVNPTTDVPIALAAAPRPANTPTSKDSSSLLA
jgi:hypothetical protein